MNSLSVTRACGGFVLRVMHGAEWMERIISTSPQMIADYIAEHWPAGTKVSWEI